MGTTGRRLIVSAFAGLIAMMALLIATQQAWAGNTYTLSSDNYTPQSVEYNYDGTSTYSYENGTIKVYDVSSGYVSYDASSKTLTLHDVSASYVDLSNDFNMTIKLEGTNTLSDDYYDMYGYSRTLTITGSGSLAADIHAGDLTITSGKVIGYVDPRNFTLRGGTVNGEIGWNVGSDNVKISGGRINGSVRCNGNFSMSGGVVSKGKGDYAVYCEGNFSKSGGTITKFGGGVDSNTDYGIDCGGNFKHSGGYITVNNADYGIQAGGWDHKTYTMQLLAGVITINSPSNCGVDLYGGNLIMKGGTLKVLNSFGEGVRVYSDTYRGKTYGGKVTVTGGLLYSTVRNPADHYAVYANSMSNKVGCMKSIKGMLPFGASFKSGGNEFKVRDGWHEIAIAKYGATSKTPSFNTWKYGSIRYNVVGVGPKAFSTKQGQKVTSIRFKQTVNYLGANAFSGTKSLTKLRFDYLPIEPKYNSNGYLRSVWYYKGTPIAKNAFAKCGKSNGKKLTVILDYVVYKSEASKYRTLFTAKGMPKGFKLKTYS